MECHLKKMEDNRWLNWITKINIFITKMTLDSVLSPKLKHVVSSAM
jgi:hypothetical protein